MNYEGIEEILVAHVSRQERVIRAKLGAVIPTDPVVIAKFDRPRWDRELLDDLRSVAVEMDVELVREIACDWNRGVEGAIRHELATSPVDALTRAFSAMRRELPSFIRRALMAAGATVDYTDAVHIVYLLFDQFDALLYVGITDRGPQRLVEHYRHKPWFPEVTKVLFERYTSRALSSDRERYLIKERQPRHNIVHNLGARSVG